MEEAFRAGTEPPSACGGAAAVEAAAGFLSFGWFLSLFR
jgi:hypothetical protein